MASVAESFAVFITQKITQARFWIFSRVNGKRCLELPGSAYGPSFFLPVYTNPAASGRSEGAGLSDLFWYWMSPGAELHQENMESGPQYDAISAATLEIVSRPKKELEYLLEKQLENFFPKGRYPTPKVINLHTVLLEFWSAFFWELIFGGPPTEQEQKVAFAHAFNCASALKGTQLRHMRCRRQMTGFLEAKLRTSQIKFPLEDSFSLTQKALYLQTVFFLTAVVQMADALSHAVLVVGTNSSWASELRSNPDFFSPFINEVFRVFPLFGISHRIAKADITIPGMETIEKGTVLLFNHSRLHREGFSDPHRFDPYRWQSAELNPSPFIPFGHRANRGCPAKGLALTTLRPLLLAFVDRFDFFAVGTHDRQLAVGAPGVVVTRGLDTDLAREMRLRENRKAIWERLRLSLRQLCFGAFMIWDASRKGLARNHFRNEPIKEKKCPFSRLTSMRNEET